MAVLISIFVYQVAYGTNESDYKYGLKFGRGMYQQCSNTHTCIFSGNYYTPECGNHLSFGSTPRPHIDNETACQHGYQHGWIKGCLNDGGGAICKPQFGVHILVGISGPGHCDASGCESGIGTIGNGTNHTTTDEQLYKAGLHTNQGSYNWGVRMGVGAYTCEAQDLGSDDCGEATGTSNAAQFVCSNTVNQTACQDGYINGWKSFVA